MKLEITENTGIGLVHRVLNNEISVSKLETRLSIADTIKKPLLRTVFKNNGSLAFTFTTAIVKRFVDSFGFSTKMTPSQVEMLVADTLDSFGYESIEDIILFFKMARSGKFGTTMRGVDSNLIFGDWYPKYMEIKSEAREKYISEEKSRKITVDKRGCSYDEVLKEYNNQASQKYKNSFSSRVEKYVERITKDMDRQILEDTIVDWSKDKDKKDYVYLLKKKRRELK